MIRAIWSIRRIILVVNNMIKITNYNVGQADCILLHFESKEEIKDKER